MTPIPPTTRMLHVLVYEEYALPWQLYLLHLDHPTQLGLLLISMKDMVLPSRYNPNRVLLRPVDDKKLNPISHGDAQSLCARFSVEGPTRGSETVHWY